MRSIDRARFVGLAAAAPAALGRLPARAQVAPIRIGAAPTDAHAEPFYARELGSFERAGLSVEITISGRSGSAAQMVAANALDICLADPIQVAHPVNAGVPLAFFAGGGMYTSAQPTTLLVVTREGALHRAQDFEGRAIAVIGLASIGSVAVNEWLRENGADPRRVQLVELQFANMVAALQRGVIAGALLAEPFLSAARGNVRVVGKAYDAISPAFALSAFFASRDWMAANRDRVRRFTDVMYQTARWANANKSDSAAILAQVSKIDVAQVRSMTRIAYATSIEPQQLQPPLDAALRYGQLERHVNARDLMEVVG